MTVFRAATLRTFFFAIFAGAKELIRDKFLQAIVLSFFKLEKFHFFEDYCFESCNLFCPSWKVFTEF